MNDREIRESIIRLLLEDDREFEEIVEKLNIDRQIILGNIEYLANNQYIETIYYADSEDGKPSLMKNQKTASYLVGPDTSLNTSIFHVHGNSNIISGNDVTIENSNVMSNVQMPDDIKNELDELITLLRDCTFPRDKKKSKAVEFFGKLAASASSAVVSSCAAVVINALLGA